MIEKYVYYLEQEAERTRELLNTERLDELLIASKIFNEFLQHEKDIEEKVQYDVDPEDY